MAAPIPEIVLRLATVAALRAALPELEKRRAFVPGADGLRLRDPCTLVLVHPESEARLPMDAEVVWVQPDGPGKGIGVELRNVDVERLRAFVGSAAPEGVVEPEEDGGPGEPSEVEEDAPPADDRTKSLYEKIRKLSAREREVCARSGVLTERVALERCYGATVWEGLLQNPQITPPEVARIARNGTASRPLLTLIVANGGWVAVGEIQRALLSNPRVAGRELDRVLRALSRSDLRRVAQQTTYRAPVRQAAQALLKP